MAPSLNVAHTSRLLGLSLNQILVDLGTCGSSIHLILDEELELLLGVADVERFSKISIE